MRVQDRVVECLDVCAGLGRLGAVISNDVTGRVDISSGNATERGDIDLKPITGQVYLSFGFSGA